MVESGPSKSVVVGSNPISRSSISLTDLLSRDSGLSLVSSLPIYNRTLGNFKIAVKHPCIILPSSSVGRAGDC